MSDILNLQVKKSCELPVEKYEEILSLSSRAFGLDYLPYLKTFPNPTHVLGNLDGRLVSHALWITRWLQVNDGPLLRTAYVEAVATEEAYRNRGFATAVMARLVDEIQDFDLGALSTGSFGFYARLGWRRWRGPLFNRTATGLQPDPEEDGVMVLLLPRTPELDLDAPLSVEWREGEVW